LICLAGLNLAYFQQRRMSHLRGLPLIQLGFRYLDTEAKAADWREN
jgi:hypothetical protein